MKAVIFAALALVAMGQGASAGDDLPVYTTRLFDLTVNFAPPPWVGSLEEIGNVETWRQQGRDGEGRDVFILEFIPKGEDFDHWSELYAIQAAIPYPASLQDSREGTFGVYAQSCEGFRWQEGPETAAETTVFILFCPSYIDDRAQGEVAVMNYQLHGKTLIQNYYHRRLPAYAFPLTPEVKSKIGAAIEASLPRIVGFRALPKPAN